MLERERSRALKEAAERGNIVTINALLSEPQTEVQISEKLYIALMAATNYGQMEVIKFLLKQKGADVNAHYDKGYTPLMAAALESKYEITKYLIEEGADIQVVDEFGYKALNYAKSGGDTRIINLIESLSNTIETESEAPSSSRTIPTWVERIRASGRMSQSDSIATTRSPKT